MATKDPTAMASEDDYGLVRTIEKPVEELRSLLREFREIGLGVVALADKIRRVHRETQNEEIKRILQVKMDRHGLVMVFKKAFVFLDKVNEFVWTCSEGVAMRALSKENRRISSLPQTASDDMVSGQVYYV